MLRVGINKSIWRLELCYMMEKNWIFSFILCTVHHEISGAYPQSRKTAIKISYSE